MDSSGYWIPSSSTGCKEPSIIWWIRNDPSMGLTLRHDEWIIVVSMISHCAVDEINILWCELIGSEPEGWKTSRMRSEACALGARVHTLVCDRRFKMLPLNIRVVYVTCATAVNVRAFLTAYISACKQPQTQPNNICLVQPQFNFHFFFQICCCEIVHPFKEKSISASESGNAKSIGERWSRHVSDFHPRHQWSSLNSSMRHNPQPVGKCEKLHKVIYTLMSIFPENSNGTQFKDTTVTFSLFSKIIPRGFHSVLSTYFFFCLWMSGMLRIDK